MNKIARFASIAAVMAVLSACGAKGPLFLPEKAVPMEEAPAAADTDTPASGTDASDTEASDATIPVEPPVEVPATSSVDGNG